MNAKELSSNDEPPSGPSTAATASDQRARSPAPWLNRLRALIGLRAPGTIREDLADALATDDAGGFSVAERAMLANVLRLREARVDDIMVPRADIEAVDIGISLADLYAAFLASGHSRMPVYRETLDDPVGLAHIKDLMRYLADKAGLPPHQPNGRGEANGNGNGAPEPRTENGADDAPEGFGDLQLSEVDLSTPLGDTGLVRNILFVPPSMTVSVLLANMQASRMQMALVIDEYGGTDGLISLEDAVETVVGDIEDEHDDETGPMIVPDGDGGYLADARAELDEVAKAIGSELGDEERDDDVETIGGLVFGLIGRVPVRGELIAGPDGFEFEVLDADPRRIKRLRLHRRPAGRRSELRRRTRTAEEVPRDP